MTMSEFSLLQAQFLKTHQTIMFSLVCFKISYFYTLHLSLIFRILIHDFCLCFWFIENGHVLAKSPFAITMMYYEHTAMSFVSRKKFCLLPIVSTRTCPLPENTLSLEESNRFQKSIIYMKTKPNKTTFPKQRW